MATQKRHHSAFGAVLASQRAHHVHWFLDDDFDFNFYFQLHRLRAELTT